MNKIIVDKEKVLDLKDNVILLDIEVPELTINVKGKVLINEINKKDEENLKLTINVEPNSSLLYNRFIIHKQMDDKIVINQVCNSEVIFNYAMIAYDLCNLKLNTNLSGNDNETTIKVKAVTEDKGIVNIEGTADTKEKIENDNLIESIKILLLNENLSVCIPNLLVASNDISVNHAATISGVSKDELFYLCSKGLKEDDAVTLIKNGYLLSNLDINEELKMKIEDLIGG